MKKGLFSVMALLLTGFLAAYGQEEKKNQLDIDLNMLGHGELRIGGLSPVPDEDGGFDEKAQFLLGRTRLTIGYKRPHLEAKVSAQHQGVWGQSGKGSFNLYEAWAQLNTKFGLFARVGRQVLSYDDERIIGSNDWAMASLSHDVLKLGYEGHGHKAHFIFGFNQNAENVSHERALVPVSVKLMSISNCPIPLIVSEAKPARPGPAPTENDAEG